MNFYPNAARMQPGCNYGHLVTALACSHSRSYEYFTQSIINEVENKCKFWAYKRISRTGMPYSEIETRMLQSCHERSSYGCVEMGINAENYIGYGNYITITEELPPFCSKFFDFFLLDLI